VSAQLQASPQLRAMHAADLDAVMAIEAQAYAFPWTRGNFIDSLAAGYVAWVLVDARGGVAAYLVAMHGVGEMHLLNITVAPPWQRCGLAQQLLQALEQNCRSQRFALLWLEVRSSNQRARDIYRRRGFAEVGLRRGYYPAALGQREDAVVMRLALDATS
jgi:[ribosomal protein S18]-alanine N-acetyltransferase